VHSSELHRGASHAPATGRAGASAHPQPAHGSPADAHAFDAVMSGFSAAAPAAPVPFVANPPSVLSQMVRLPSRAFSEGMAEVQAPLPPGLSVMQSMEFYAHKQIRMNEIKTLQNLSGVVVRLARKDIETVLNSK
jgi:hypothetical protein